VRLTPGTAPAVQPTMEEARYMKLDTRGMQHDGLQCEVLTLDYDFIRKVGKIYFPPVNCCNMTDCIELFQHIDPAVSMIYTFAGDWYDTAYRKDRIGWAALSPLRETKKDQPVSALKICRLIGYGQ
jgi:hypothetical protein